MHDATVQKDQAATRKANQERWSRIKNGYEQRDCDQKNAGKMTVVTTAMDTHVARRNGSTKREPVDIAFRPAKEAQHSEQVDQDQTEDVARAPYSNQDQAKTEDVTRTPYSS